MLGDAPSSGRARYSAPIYRFRPAFMRCFMYYFARSGNLLNASLIVSRLSSEEGRGGVVGGVMILIFFPAVLVGRVLIYRPLLCTLTIN